MMKQRWGLDWNKTTCCDRHLEIPGCRTAPLEHRSKRKPTDEPRWAKQQTKKLWPQPTKINSFMSGPSLSLTPTHRRAIKEWSKVINRDWVNKHADCRIIFMSYPRRFNIWLFFWIDPKRTDQKNQSYLHFFLLYIQSNYKILVPTDLDAKVFLIQRWI